MIHLLKIQSRATWFASSGCPLLALDVRSTPSTSSHTMKVASLRITVSNRGKIGLRFWTSENSRPSPHGWKDAMRSPPRADGCSDSLVLVRRKKVIETVNLRNQQVSMTIVSV